MEQASSEEPWWYHDLTKAQEKFSTAQLVDDFTLPTGPTQSYSLLTQSNPTLRGLIWLVGVTSDIYSLHGSKKQYTLTGWYQVMVRTHTSTHNIYITAASMRSLLGCCLENLCYADSRHRESSAYPAERERERVRRFGIESWCKQHSGVELPTMQDDTYKWQQKHHRCSLSLCHTSHVRTYIHT